MGFLIFAYRKLFLKSKINNIDFEMMCLTQKKQRITDNIGMVQQSFSAMKNVVTACTQDSLFAAQKEALSKYPKGQVPPEAEAELATKMMVTSQAAMVASQGCNSVFESAQQAQLLPLSSEDSQISLRMANLESQEKQLRYELESVEKTEDATAKAEAPKFGL